MDSRKDVILFLQLGQSHLNDLVRGICDYAQANRHWQLTVMPNRSIVASQSWKTDGVIAALYEPAEVRKARRLGVPVVNVSGVLVPGPLPRVITDSVAVARMAAEHLLVRGFLRLGFYCSEPGAAFARLREMEFRRLVEAAGKSCAVFRPSGRILHDLGPVQRWLLGLQLPVGVFCSSDACACRVIQACRFLSLRIPEDVAVLGVDNDRMICEYGSPPLSSIRRDSYRQGYEAAAMLGRLMAGHAGATEVLVPPLGVVERRSTDILAVEDAHVFAAMNYVRANIDRRFGVAEVARNGGISRVWLERRFREVAGQMPLEYIVRQRIAKACGLLKAPSGMRLKEIASSCGFSNSTRMNAHFRKTLGLSCAEYRKTARG